MSALDPDFTAYRCGDYLESPYAREGYYSAPDQWWVVLPKEQAVEICDISDNSPLGFLKIGCPGIDGVSFGYRRDEEGIWSYDPILNEFLKIANDFPEFLQLYKDGHLQW
jgi:hypothetical protein